MKTRIAVGVDLRASGPARLVERAAAFAVRSHARLDLVWVGLESESAREDLARLMNHLPEPIRGETRIEPGAPVDALLHVSESVDALVVGPREPNAALALITGTIATRIARGAHSAVLVARREPLDRAPRLLVGIDPHRDVSFVLGEAARWAERLGGSVDGVYVDPAELSEGSSPDERVHQRKAMDLARGPLREALTHVLSAIPLPWRGEVRIAEGQPERALVDLSPEYDIVVVGTLAKAGFLGAWRESVADHVIRNAACDVLTVPSATRIAGG